MASKANEGTGQALQTVRAGQDSMVDIDQAGLAQGLAGISLDVAERLLVMGDLSQLAPRERLMYYQALCKSLGLNPVSRPFEYVVFLGGRLTLYATKEAAAQLRTLRQVSFTQMHTSVEGGLCIVSVQATLPDGRTDMDEGITQVQGLSGNDLANARMKAITKAKRRVTLSICGLGMLDETELDTVQGAQRVDLHEVHTQQAYGPGILTSGGHHTPERDRSGQPTDVEPPSGHQAYAAAQAQLTASQRPAGPPEPTTDPPAAVQGVVVDFDAQELMARFASLWNKLDADGVPAKELQLMYRQLVPDGRAFKKLDADTMQQVVQAFDDYRIAMMA